MIPSLFFSVRKKKCGNLTLDLDKYSVLADTQNQGMAIKWKKLDHDIPQV